ncbi:MAG TPA: DUF1501 domain-containing protein [Steroidobacteraceae bacterium]|nr:DUF1501 domain-containing protein [Steroidobacteraceae bacterium]
MHRRQLLKTAAAATLAAALPLPRFAFAEESPAPLRRLLLIELNGGNDGLNTVIPYADPLYRQLRPQLAIERDKVLQLSEQLGLHPALDGLMPLFAAGELAIVQGLGYADANRSHFRSIEIWDTATDSNQTGTEGWLSRLDVARQFGRSFAASAVVIGRNPKPVTGSHMQPVVMADAGSFVNESQSLDSVPDGGGNAALRHIIQVERDILQAGHALSANRPAAQAQFPRTPFGRDAAEAARLLIGDPVAPIVKIALTGFDTHANQQRRHEVLLQQLGATLVALRQAFVAAGIWDDTLIVTYSEFGRRAQQNASGGTDHGKAAAQFVLGGKVRGGLHGATPALARLDDGDLGLSIDFRCVYNAVLGRWWSATDALIEPRRFAPLQLV